MSSVTKGDKNGMYKQNNYKVWFERYGKEIADEKDKLYREKQSVNNLGSKNNMYGKPSPQGSGNGWSGWYKNWHFRSLLELSYMINVIEKHNLSWKSAETKEFRIPYIDYLGNRRNYYADFIIDNKYLVEIKPFFLKESYSVKNKKTGAENFCKNNGLIYKIECPEKISQEFLMKLYLSRNIVFVDRYEEKFKKRYLP